MSFFGEQSTNFFLTLTNPNPAIQFGFNQWYSKQPQITATDSTAQPPEMGFRALILGRQV